MMQHDTLMRQIHQFSQVLSQMLFNKRNEQYDEALYQLHTATHQLLNLNLKNVTELTFEELWQALHRSGGVEPEHAGLLAELLRQQGEIHAIEERVAPARRSFELALHLFLILHDHPGAKLDYRSPINDLLAHLDPYALPGDIQELLVPFYRKTGRFAEAENILFIWAERTETDPRPTGRAFFEDLLALDDETLEAGGLPREEVREARSAFEETFGLGTRA